MASASWGELPPGDRPRIVVPSVVRALGKRTEGMAFEQMWVLA
jgi:hypothetical protein